MRHWLLLLLVVAVTAVTLAQAPSDQKRSAFDVASVKPNTSGARQASIQMNVPDGFSATNQTLQSLVSLMYQVPVFKITGAPGWFATDRFDMVGKADRRLTIDEKREMVRTLLEDRFRLVTHRETHEGRMYTLTFARGDHQLGPNIKRSRYDCDAINAARQRGDLSAIPTPPAGEPPPCGAFGGRQFRARGVKIPAFALTLGTMMRETVVDETGLTAIGIWMRPSTSQVFRDLPLGLRRQQRTRLRSSRPFKRNWD